MLKFSVRKKLSRILAGTLSAAMAMTMVPDIWLPIYADSVRNDILNADIISEDEEIIEDSSVEDIINDDVVDEINDDEVNNNLQPYASQNIKYEYNGHTYSFIDIGMTWNNAKLYCENEGGHLATITSPEENDFLVDLISNGSMNTYWIGLTDGGGSNYSWITGEPFVESCGTIANYNTRQYFYQLQKDGIWNDHDDGLRNDFWDYTKCGILCEWDYIDNEPIPDELNYTIFSGSTSQGVSLYGWKSYFTGDIYTGNNFTYGGSELYVNGKIDAAGTITTNGWITEITERNEAVNSIAMPDYDEAIEGNAQPYEYFEESPAYVQDRNIINSSIKVGGDVIISGTTFEGDCYIIAEGNITYNVQDFKSTGRVFLYSKNGNITINGSQININGAMYAPKGNVTFNTYDTTVTGFVCADTINFNGSLFNITGANFDMVKPKSKGIIKTYTLDEDFNEGSLDGVSLAVPDQLILAEKEAGEETELEKIYGDTESGKGVKITMSSDKSTLSEDDDSVNIKFGLSGFGNADVNENAIDLILVVDESGSMRGSRMTNTKSAAKEIISQMKDNDRCAVIGFTYSTSVKQTLTSDKVLLNSAVEKLYANGGTNISTGINKALDMFNTMSDDSRQKYIILLSDGEDEYVTVSLNAATKAGENNIRIFAMMIGTGTLQMQNIAINSNGIYKNAPTAADIGKIMSYFAAEVFNVAGRNTTYSPSQKDTQF